MDKLRVQFENCYGIKALDASFDFSVERAYAVYAPNGVMKSSFAQTFLDASRGEKSRDRIFVERATKRSIQDEGGKELGPESIFVIRPYDEEFGPTEKTSSLLVDSKLRKEYENIHAGIERTKDVLLKALKNQSGSKRDFEREISSAFTRTETDFKTALGRIRKELADQKDAPFANVVYEKVFDDKVISFLTSNTQAQAAISGYVDRYNELLTKSTYFKRGTFDYYNAGEIAKSLSANGFFAAQHTVNLNAANSSRLEIKDLKELEGVITKEKESIIKDRQLRKQFDDLQKSLEKNVTLRDFYNYLLENETLVSQLANPPKFKEEVLKSYLKANWESYCNLMTEYDNAETRSREIEAEAALQQTQWEAVIDIFNNRFFVPFTLDVNNRTAVMLGDEPMVSLGFTYHDGDYQKEVDKKALLGALSTGERKALYVLNVIFEIRRREQAAQETLIVVDDIADSFDYQNKYAIIQYLRDISQNPLFKQVILTHNFDFFRTVKLRFVSYSHCRMATKSIDGIELSQAVGIENIFVKDWKKEFFSDPKKKVASIAFIRNIIEYTKGPNDSDYLKLTSLLHWKADSETITVGDLDVVYGKVFGGKRRSKDPAETVFSLIVGQIPDCIKDCSTLRFENKIVMSIAIRLTAEKYMAERINDANFLAGIKKNQTYELLKRFKSLFPTATESASVLERVSLMTPENIHLNSFMYEPIIDMSDEHLKKLCQDVANLR